MQQDTLDFVIEDGGSIVLVTPMTPEARAWADEHVGSDNGYQPYWPTIVVEANYAGDLIDGIASEGFVL